MREVSQAFDTEKIVAQYRATIGQLEVQGTDPGRAEFRAIALRLRREWKAWQGEDSLHEMAFGEFVD
jgi:hypothetical protein